MALQGRSLTIAGSADSFLNLRITLNRVIEEGIPC